MAFSFKNISRIASLAGSALSTGAAIYQGVSAHRQSKEQAKLERLEAEREARLIRRETERLASDQRARFLAAGVTIDGSAALLVEETEQIGAEDAQFVLDIGQKRAKLIKKQGRNALIAGGINAGGNLLGAYADYEFKDRKGYFG